MKNKKGAEMTIGTIIVIILALVVLVVMVYGFTVGWGNLWENIKNFGGGKVNVQTIIKTCEVACASQSTYDYCTLKRSVVFDDTGTKNPKNKQTYTCSGLESELSGLSCDNFICPSKEVQP